MDTGQKTIQMRAFLELKNGNFLGLLELLQQPERWKDLTAADRRLIKRYAARLRGASFETPEERVREEVNADSSKAVRDEVKRKHDEARKPQVYEPPVRRKVTFIPSAMPMPALPVRRREQPKYCGICHTFGCKEHPNG